jgi:hypothetical protein
MTPKKMMAFMYIVGVVLFHSKFTDGFLFNKKNRDITNAIITASFSPLFDRWINELTDTPTPSTSPTVTNILEVVEYPQFEAPFSLKNGIHKLKKSKSKDKDMAKVVDVENYKPFDMNTQPVQTSTNTQRVETSTNTQRVESNINTQPTDSNTNFERNIYIETEEDVYDSPVFEIFNTFKKSHLNTVIEPYTNDESVYYVIGKDPTPVVNNDLSLKLNRYEGLFMVTGEIIIIILLVSILTELQKLTMIQRNNAEK